MLLLLPPGAGLLAMLSGVAEPKRRRARVPEIYKSWLSPRPQDGAPFWLPAEISRHSAASLAAAAVERRRDAALEKGDPERKMPPTLKSTSTGQAHGGPGI